MWHLISGKTCCYFYPLVFRELSQRPGFHLKCNAFTQRRVYLCNPPPPVTAIVLTLAEQTDRLRAGWRHGSLHLQRLQSPCMRRRRINDNVLLCLCWLGPPHQNVDLSRRCCDQLPPSKITEVFTLGWVLRRISSTQVRISLFCTAVKWKTDWICLLFCRLQEQSVYRKNVGALWPCEFHYSFSLGTFWCFSLFKGKIFYIWMLLVRAVVECLGACSFLLLWYVVPSPTTGPACTLQRYQFCSCKREVAIVPLFSGSRKALNRELCRVWVEGLFSCLFCA